MTATRLKLIYDLHAKYEKLKWLIKSPRTVLGKNVTFIFEVENFLKYGGLDLSINDVKMTKDVAKFFDSIYDVYEISLDDSEYSTKVYDEVYDEIHDDLGNLLDHVNHEERRYILSIFYTNNKLNQWKTVEKNYDFNNLPPQGGRAGDPDLRQQGKPDR